MSAVHDTQKALSQKERLFAMLALICAGEAIFFLPFVIPRVFRPTYLSVFGIDNFQLGTFFSVYGFVAIGAYLFGGPLADRFPPHRLMVWALVSTGIGGLYLSIIPSIAELRWLYGFWGLTTILLFWASMMRTTRILGGESTQGLAFGALDGGRGLVAAVVGSIALWILSIFIGSEVLDVDPSERAAAFKKVILFFSLLIFAISILVAYALRPLARTSSIDFERLSAEGLRKVLRLPTVWLQALIIICAYSGYRVADDFSLLAQDVLGYNEVDAAGVGTISLWLRPIAAIGAGLLADRVSTSRMTQCCFILLIIAGLVMGFWPITANVSLVVLFVIVTTCVGVYALRGLYFAIMKEGRIPIAVTGTAVGMASIVGYLPDIYMAPLTGWLVDEYPGALGHQYVFMLLAAFSVLGLVATIIFRSVAKA